MRKSPWLLILLGLLSLALVTGCPSKKVEKEEANVEEVEDDDDDEAEEETEEEKEEEKAEKEEEKEEEKAEKEEEKEEEKAEKEEEKAENKEGSDDELPSRENYIEATVAIGCSSLDSSLDPSQRTERRKEILAKYGFTEDTYNKTKASLKDDLTVKPVIMERVTKASCSKDGVVKTETAKIDMPDDKNKVRYGSYRGSVSGSGARGNINLNIKPGRLVGNMKGTDSKGARWNTGISGSVNGASFSGRGSNKKTSLRVSGKIVGKRASGTVSGRINGKGVSMRFSASGGR